MRDPKFVESIREALKKKVSPVQSLQKTLTRKRLPKYHKLAFKKSILIHCLILFVSLLNLFVQQYFLEEKKPSELLTLKEQKTAIRVEVLDLPSKKISDLRKVDVSEKAVKKVKKKELPNDAMVLKENKERKMKVDKARKSLRAESRRKKLLADLLNDQDEVEAEDGREELGGNILSEGYSLTGDVASDKQVHSGKVRNHVMKFWKVPAWMAASKQYRAEIVLKLDPKGKIVSKELLKKSGNSEFDRYAMQAIEAADPFPPPPDSLKMIYLEEGVLCAFPD